MTFATATIPAAVADAIGRAPGQTAIVDGDLRLTYEELGQRIAKVAAAMRRRGVGHGTTVAIWMPNRWEWIVAAVAAQSLRAVVVPVNTRFKGDEVADVLRRARTHLLVTVGTFLGSDYPQLLERSAGRAFRGLPDLAAVVTVGGASAVAGCVPWSELDGAGEDDDASGPHLDELARQVRADDVSDVLFTSGTTGFPKGAVCTHGVTVRAYRSLADVVGLRHADRYLIVNPFFHAFGYKAGWFSALDHCCTVLPVQTLDVARVLDLIERERVTVFPGSPAVYQTIIDSGLHRGRDLRSLRMSITGASQVAPGFAALVASELGFAHVLSGYGLTEACGVGTMCRPDDPPDIAATTNGRAIPGMELRIADPAGRDLAAGEPGEVLLRGFTMVGYLGDPDATAEAFDPQGWLRTGDLGSVDAAGNLTILDRLKDVVIVGGFNVYPAEVERILAADPRIADCAVIGVPDRRLGEVVHAFVVAADRALGAEDVIAWAREHMANFKVPRSVELVSTLPKAVNGKVRRSELRKAATT